MHTHMNLKIQITLNPAIDREILSGSSINSA